VKRAAGIVTIVAALGGQTFRSGTDAVRVDVLVTDRDVTVAGLTAQDFELRDNTVVQQIDAVAIEDLPVSMMLALDTSLSVGGSALDDLKRAATAALEALDPRDRAALITFSSALRMRADWTSDRAAVRQTLESLTAGGRTAVWDAAYAAMTMRDDDPTRRSLVVLFSDGADTGSWLPHAAIVERARRSEVVVYGVSVGTPETRLPILHRSGIRLSDARPAGTAAILPQLADITGGRSLRAGNTGALAETFRRIVREFRTRYLLTYSPRNVAPDGWHAIDVKLKNRRGEVRARRGYLR